MQKHLCHQSQPVWTAVCSCAAGWVPPGTTGTCRGGRRVCCISYTLAEPAKSISFLHALFMAQQCDCGLSSQLYPKGVQGMSVMHSVLQMYRLLEGTHRDHQAQLKTPCTGWKEFHGGTGRKLTPREAETLVSRTSVLKALCRELCCRQVFAGSGSVAEITQ